MMIISHNGIKTFFECPAKFKHRYILRSEKDKDTENNLANLYYGSITHEIARYYSTLIVNNSDFTLLYQDFLEILSGILAEDRDYFAFSTDEYIAKFYIHALCIVHAYKNKLLNIRMFKTEEKLANNSILDVYLTTPEYSAILDYKTCSTFESRKLSSLQNDLQMNYYAITCGYHVDYLMHFELLKTSHKLTKKDTNPLEFVNRILDSKENKIENFYRIIKAKYDEQYTEYLDLILAKIRETKEFYCNFNNCVNMYGQSCEYYSKCNLNNYTEKVNEVL